MHAFIKVHTHKHNTLARSLARKLTQACTHVYAGMHPYIYASTHSMLLFALTSYTFLTY